MDADPVAERQLLGQLIAWLARIATQHRGHEADRGAHRAAMKLEGEASAMHSKVESWKAKM